MSQLVNPALWAPKEGGWQVWRRRVISIPLVSLLGAFAWAGLPLWLLLASLSDVLSRRRASFAHTRAVGFFALFLLVEVAGIVGAAAVWLFVPRREFIAANAALQRRWTGALYRGSFWLFSMKLSVENAELAKGGPFLLFVRHTSTADTVLAAALVANPHKMLLRYVLKSELLWDPCLDIVGRRLPNVFVSRDGLANEVARVASLTRGLDESSAVLIYPEGARFDPVKQVKALASLQTKGHAELARIAAGYRNVMPPRLGGPLALIEAARHLDVVFLEHVGLERATRFSEFWNGSLVGQTLRVRFRRFSAESIPRDATDVWLFERWAETDAWVSQ